MNYFTEKYLRTEINMVWTCYAVKLGISTLLAAAKLGISPPIPTITLSIQHEGLHYSHKHLESSQWTCQHILENTICVENVLVSHWRLVVKKGQTMNQVCNILAESQQPLVWNNGNRQLMLPLLRREEITERTKRQSVRVFAHYRFFWGGHENHVLPRMVWWCFTSWDQMRKE